MVKGNKAIPHLHQRKHWNPNSSQKGNIRVWLNQPKQKERRRRLRAAKAKRVFPRPLRALRPQVNCPTIRYNMRKRLGRGFSLEELKAAEIAPRKALTIGIRVDRRRKNLSEEGLKANVQRLKQYMSKLILFPINNKKVKAGEATEADTKKVQQDKSRNGTGAVPHPRTIVVAPDAPRKVTPAERKKSVYRFLKINHSAVRFLGERKKRMTKRAEKEAAKQKKDAKKE